jgi:hypothetical protein
VKFVSSYRYESNLSGLFAFNVSNDCMLYIFKAKRLFNSMHLTKGKSNYYNLILPLLPKNSARRKDIYELSLK